MKSYRGDDAINKFMKAMFQEVENCQDIAKNHFNKPLVMSKKDEKNFKKDKRCWICNKIYKIDDEPVRDHCHITGKYRGSAHSYCNLKLKISPEKLKIPVVFHNLRGYDSHFIINDLGELISEGEELFKTISIIPNNSEKYMAFYIGKHLSFIDSYQFMSSSLEKLAENLPKEKFIYTGEYFGKNLKLMKRKGVYPYDYMDSFEKFNETNFPPKEDFYSILNDEHIVETDYKHAKKVWDTFDLKNMGEYHDLYLHTDILLLADVFENFRKLCLENYGLDPAHYVSSQDYLGMQT